MSDDDLLALIGQTPPEEWSPEQMELLRARLPHSAVLQAALAEHLKLEDYLAAAVGATNVSAAAIVARAKQREPRTERPRTLWPYIASVALLLAATAVVMWRIEEVRTLVLGEPVVEGDAGDLSRLAHDDTPPLEATSGDPTPKVKPPSTPPKATAGASGEGVKPPPNPENAAASTPPDVPRVPAVSAEKTGPWLLERHLGGPVRPYDAVAFESLTTGAFATSAKELRRWFVPVGGQPLAFHDRDHDGRRCGIIEGRGKLLPPWSPDAMLRLALADANKLRLYFWSGDEGVMLHYHEDRRLAWAAYRVTRKFDPATANESWRKPAQTILAATDDDRSYRTSMNFAGPVDLFWRDGELVLARGGIVLVRAPFAAMPNEVYFDGRALFRGLAMVRATDFPPPDVLPAPTSVDAKLDAREWDEKLPKDAAFIRHDGAVELASTNSKDASTATTLALPAADSRGIYEITCRLDAYTPGASIYLAAADGRTLECLRVMKHQPSGQLGLWFTAWGDGRTDVGDDFNSGPVPLVGPTCWVRMIVGAGVLRAALSPDGAHWSQPWGMRATFNIPPQRLGLALAPVGGQRSIRLGEIRWRKLKGVAALASAEAHGKVTDDIAKAGDAIEWEDWRKRVLAARPSDVDENAWIAACAYRAMSLAPPEPFFRLLVSRLAERAVESALPLPERLRALDDLALLANTWEDSRRAADFLRQYEQAALAVVNADPRGGEPIRPYTIAAPAMIQSPLACRHGAFPPLRGLGRLELLSLAGNGAWTEVDRLARVLRFRDEQRYLYSRREPTIVDWAAAHARHRLRESTRDETAMAMQPSWQNPLVEQLNTDAFNLLSEFAVALGGESYRDAAEIIASAGNKLGGDGETLGVSTDAKDPGLFVSPRAAVEQAMREHPPLADAMREHFGPTARLRVQKAIVEGDVAALEAATLQFHGTQAAREARLWLGNRALASGDFAAALSQFSRAAEGSGVDAADEVAAAAAARQRLASALLGRTGGEPQRETVSFGETKLAAVEFERLVFEVRERAAASAASSITDATESSSRRALAANTFTFHRWGDAQLAPVAPPSDDNDGAPRMEVDWLARRAQ